MNFVSLCEKVDLLGIIFLMDKIKFIFKKFCGFCHVILSTKMQNKALTLNSSHCPCRSRVIQVLTSHILILVSLNNLHEPG